MTEDQAWQVVQRQRQVLQIDPDMELASAERMIVEYKKDRTRPGPCEDRLAWTITLSSNLGLVQVHVDDRTGEILAVRSSA